MDVLTALSEKSEYSTTKLQMILAAWVLSTPFERSAKVSLENGRVEEEDYDKQSIYSLLYSLYRSMGVVRSDTGEPYKLTFNTWGYTWPATWDTSATPDSDPQRFGKNAYTGLFQFPSVKDYVSQRDGRVHVVEMGCGTGAGAHHVCKTVLPKCTYEAIDMQQAAIRTCQQEFVPELDHRLVATRADCTEVPIEDGTADIVAVCETHVTEIAGKVLEEDRQFFTKVQSILKTGGFLVWGNAIPDKTWQPCLDYLASIGMKLVESHDVTAEAIAARDQDEARVDAYVEQCLERFLAFRIPVFGPRKRAEAEIALKNFYRNPGTNLYVDMENGTDSYKVVLLEKTA